MSHYSDYLLEREEKHILEIEQGFCVYKFIGAECYIVDIYVKPDFRQKGVASNMADKVKEIAKSNGCKWLTGSVSPPARGSHESLLILIAYGMRLIRADKDMIYFGVELK